MYSSYFHLTPFVREYNNWWQRRWDCLRTEADPLEAKKRSQESRRGEREPVVNRVCSGGPIVTGEKKSRREQERVKSAGLRAGEREKKRPNQRRPEQLPLLPGQEPRGSCRRRRWRGLRGAPPPTRTPDRLGETQTVKWQAQPGATTRRGPTPPGRGCQPPGHRRAWKKLGQGAKGPRGTARDRGGGGRHGQHYAKGDKRRGVGPPLPACAAAASREQWDGRREGMS